jgi:hypothetical protein
MYVYLLNINVKRVRERFNIVRIVPFKFTRFKIVVTLVARGTI